MLYLDYSRKPGQWTPNEFGGRESLGGIQFLRRANERIHIEFPGALDSGRRIDGLADGVATDGCWRSGV